MHAYIELLGNLTCLGPEASFYQRRRRCFLHNIRELALHAHWATNFDIWPVVFMKGCKCIGCDTMRSCPLPIIAIFQIMSGVWSNILSVMEYLYSQTVPSWSNMPRAGGLANAFRAFLYGQPWSLFNLHTSISCICVDQCIRDPLSESLDLCCSSSSKYVFLFL